MSNEELLKEYNATFDEKIINQLIINNIPLVKHIANKYAEITNIEIDDLCGYGYLGLISAINLYNPTLNNKFSTYAYPCIEGYIIKGAYQFQGLSSNKFSSEYLKQKSIFEQDGQYLGDHIEFADNIIDNLIDKEVISKEERKHKKTQILINNPISFENSEDEYNDENIIEDSMITNIFNEELRNEFNNLFTHISERQKNVIELYYGFNGVPKTVKEIAEIYHVSEALIYKIKRKALKNLKELALTHKLDNYLNEMNNAYDENSKLLYKQKRNQN